MSEFYDGIMEGLTDALAYVKGDTSRARTQTISDETLACITEPMANLKACNVSKPIDLSKFED